MSEFKKPPFEMPSGSWFNYITQEYEWEYPSTDEIAKRYIPQHPAAQGLYDANRGLGLSIEKAMVNTLLACVGEPRRF